MELQFKLWLEAVDKSMGAYWISPSGSILPVVGGIHINNIVKDPRSFGFTSEKLQATFEKHGESPDQEGNARNELMNDAMIRGWIRIRRRNRPDFWSVQSGVLNKPFYKRMRNWAWDMLGAEAAHKFDDIRMNAVSPNQSMMLKRDDRTTFEELTIGDSSNTTTIGYGQVA